MDESPKSEATVCVQVSGSGIRASLRWAVPAALFAGAACVSCTLGLVALGLAAVGVSLTPLLGLSPLFAIPLAAALVPASIFTARALRREEQACSTTSAASHYTRFSGRNAIRAILLAVAAVVGIAFTAKLLFENVLGIQYEIHWTTTVPPLIAGFAWLLHGELNKRDHAAATPPVSNVPSNR